jgi:cell division protein FtsN
MIKYNRQAGGTILGIIIGLIMGLSIAVVVALVINKSSIPFLTKSGKVEKPAELTAAQAADPNRPLFGSKEAAREAARDFEKEKADPTVEERKVTPDATKPVVSATDAKAADVDKTAIKPENAEDKWIYYLQAGAFREQADAESAKAKLALQGFEASISERTSENGVLYRVRLGPYTQLDAMNRVRGKLSDSGVDVAVVRSAK